MAQRIKGQEVTLSFTDPSGAVENLGVAQSFDIELDMEILEEGYLGETSNRFDDIFNGVSGNAEFHMEKPGWARFSELVQRRAQRRDAAGGKFSATGSFQFPSGERLRLTCEDIFFGAMPVKVGGRGEYVSGNLTWKCSELRRVL